MPKGAHRDSSPYNSLIRNIENILYVVHSPSLLDIDLELALGL